jgi:hypothetical protein
MENIIYTYIENGPKGLTFNVWFDSSTKNAYVSVRSPAGAGELVYDEPSIGDIIHMGCVGTTLDKVIYQGSNSVSYVGETNSTSCGYTPPPPPPPEETFTSTKSFTAICGTNYTGSYTSSKTATSTISQADADSKALALAQQDAESRLVCTVALNFTSIEEPYNEEGFTLSYSPPLQSWSSFHSYVPSYILSKGNKVLMSDNTGIYELGAGTAGQYFTDNPQPMSLTFVINAHVDATKTFGSTSFHVSSSNQGVERPWDMFNRIRFSNKVQNTDWLDIIVPKSFSEEHVSLQINQVFAKRKMNEFRLAIPSDLVKDPSVSIFDTNNLHSDRMFRPRIKGKYSLLELIYDNKDNNDFQLHALKTEFRPTSG